MKTVEDARARLAELRALIKLLYKNGKRESRDLQRLAREVAEIQERFPHA